MHQCAWIRGPKVTWPGADRPLPKVCAARAIASTRVSQSAVDALPPACLRRRASYPAAGTGTCLPFGQ